MNKIVCNVCIKIYSPTYMAKHKQTLLHLENAYEYYVDERIEEKFENCLFKLIYIIIKK